MNMLQMPEAFEKCSFIRARDPSIISYNGFKINQARKKLDERYDENSTVEDTKKEAEHLQVYLRIKKTQENQEPLYEIQNNTVISKVPANSNAMRNCKDGEKLKKLYVFSKIFPENSTQLEVFNEDVKIKILDFINGKNSSLLTYGTSGSGKTYTIVGTEKEPGLIPRSLEYLFRTLSQISDVPTIKPHSSGTIHELDSSSGLKEVELREKILNTPHLSAEKNHHIKTYKEMQQRLSNNDHLAQIENGDVSIAIWVSFAEIYNEHIYDLLQLNQKGKSREKLKLMKNENGEVYIKDITHVSVSTGIQAYLILQYGLQYLNYASTNINSHSSRSHCIFSIKLAQMTNDSGTYNLSSFNFCDLAGSERVKKTLNQGDRLKESNNINTSLMVLHRCISHIRESQKNKNNKLIPFRESKLTQLLQKALQGYENISMIVNINPSLNMFDETQHVLNFSAIAKDVIISIVPLPPLKKNRFSEKLQLQKYVLPEVDEEKEELKATIEQLCERLNEEISENKEKLIETRNELMAEHTEMLLRTDEMWKRKCDRMKATFEEEQKMKLKWQKVKYERLLESATKKRKLDNDVICLDSSNEIVECENCGKERQEAEETIEYLNNQLQEKITEVTRLKSELVKLKEQLAYEMQYMDNKSAMIKQESTESTSNEMESNGHTNDFNMFTTDL